MGWRGPDREEAGSSYSRSSVRLVPLQDQRLHFPPWRYGRAVESPRPRPARSMRPMSGARSRSRESSTFVPLRSSRGTRAPQAVLDCSPQRVAPRGRHAAAEPQRAGVGGADDQAAAANATAATASSSTACGVCGPRPRRAGAARRKAPAGRAPRTALAARRARRRPRRSRRGRSGSGALRERTRRGRPPRRARSRRTRPRRRGRCGRRDRSRSGRARAFLPPPPRRQPRPRR